MPDFSWLDDIPDEVCERHGNGRRRSFLLDWFLQESGLPAGADWRDEFDAWGAQQARRYQQFPSPPSTDGKALAFIVWGPWDQPA